MRYVYILLLLAINAGISKAQTVKLIEQGKPCSIRGLSVVNDHVAWISGSKGHIAQSTDGGLTWKWQQLKGYEQSDFRDIEAFSDKEAIIMSSGTPALILKTVDGGLSWKEVYKNEDKSYFLDAMDFAGKQHGFVMGDPIDGKFLLLETKDGGLNWNKHAVQPAAVDGEAAFAASGTCLTVNAKTMQLTLVTGGSVARKITVNGKKADALNLPLAQGKPAAGIFSVANGNSSEVFVGGNYEKNNRADSVACYLPMGKKTSKPELANQQPAGFQSCVIYLQGATFISTGTSGSNITTDGGINWKPFDTISYNACQKAKQGKLVIFAGDRGKIGILQL
ncbi:WD40/YVTN/BNR-like repeat-containing protein [Mucilaginibacter terrae]|uniref:Photosystem II stability/assembly factor-like uncharacterized protein n=1 Tax=Mucilaginibacter terrae TaxID=1955052 RepID=A0ABU3GZ92_9SPHI|nr:YCF48-related protein [Mucilaginibacter terrae]MDT3405087.1 photosystem II stability/assembly factor-like uncharacterized protein [Mucilaginibacter terrae]